MGRWVGNKTCQDQVGVSVCMETLKIRRIMMRKQCIVIQFFNLMTFYRPILMIKFFGNQSSVQSVMYLEADTKPNVTNVYTATCTGAAEPS